MRAILWAIIVVAGVDALFLVWWVGESQFDLTRTTAAVSGGLAAVLLVVPAAAWMHTRSTPTRRRWAIQRPTRTQRPARTQRPTPAASARVLLTAPPVVGVAPIAAIAEVTVELPLLDLPAPAELEPEPEPVPAVATHAAASNEIASYQSMLTGCEQLLGADHVETITARAALAGACWAVGRLSQAIELYEHTVADSHRVLGARHPLTLASRANLAGAYELDSRLPEAIALYEEILAVTAEVYGDDHPETTATRDNLAVAYAVHANLGRDRDRLAAAPDAVTPPVASSMDNAVAAQPEMTPS